MDRSVPRADSRGRYFMPQSGASTMRSAGTYASARSARLATTSAVSTAASPRFRTPRMIVLPASSLKTAQSRSDWAVSMEIWSAVVAASSGRNEQPDAVFLGGVRPGLQVRLVELDDVRSGREQVGDLGVDRLRVPERGGFLARVMVVLRLLGHRERSGHRHLDGPVGVGPQEGECFDIHRVPSPDRPADPGYRVRMAAAVQRGAGVVDVDAVQRGRERVGVALPSDLAVGDDVQPG